MKLKINQNKIIAFLTCFFILIGFSTLSLGATQQDKDKLNQVEKNLKNKQTQLNDNQKSASQLLSEVKKLDTQISALDSQIEIYNGQKAKVVSELKKSQEELDAAKEKRAKAQELLKDRLQVMYMYGDSGYLELLFSSKSFSDLIGRAMTIQSLVDFDKKAIDDLQDAERVIKEKTDEIDVKNKELANILSKLSSEQNTLDSLKSQRSSKLKIVNSDIANLKKQIAQEEKEAAELRKLIYGTTSGTNYGNGVLGWPAPGYSRITSSFGYRIHPITHTKKFHTGVDVGVPSGSNIVAPGNGKVTLSKYYGGYGYTVIIDLGLVQGKKVSVLLAHNSSLKVKAGQRVTKGQVVAKSGSTGNSTGPHLHFEVLTNGSYVNPLNWAKP